MTPSAPKSFTSARLKHVAIYTDGACKGNPGPGGIGVVMLYKKHRKEISMGWRRTTNNRMELLALITALESLNEPCVVQIYSDSKYVLDALQKGWVRNWRRNGWMTSTKHPVQNRDLWERLDLLVKKHTPQFTWVKGHASNKENNRCDEIAVAAAKSPNLPPDVGYEGKSPESWQDGSLLPEAV